MASPIRIHVLTDVKCKRRRDRSETYNFAAVTVDSAIVQCFMDEKHAQVCKGATVVLNGCKVSGKSERTTIVITKETKVRRLV